MESPGGGLALMEVRILRGSIRGKNRDGTRRPGYPQQPDAGADRVLLPSLRPCGVRGASGLNSDPRSMPLLMSGVRALLAESVDEFVAIFLWRGSEIAETQYHLIRTGNAAPLPQMLAVIKAICGRVPDARKDRAGRVLQDWHCVGCGSVSCAFFLAADAASPPRRVSSTTTVKWDGHVFPHCDASSCRKLALAKATERSKGDPNALIDGGFCAACPAISTDRGRGMQRCGRCRVMRYCSAECHRRDWPKHKAKCAPRGGQ